jgi:hypothetical protein
MVEFPGTQVRTLVAPPLFVTLSVVNCVCMYIHKNFVFLEVL